MHDVERFLESLLAQTFTQKRNGAVALPASHLEERHAMTHKRGVDVAPFAPLDCIDGKKRLGPLLCRQRTEEFRRRFCDRLGRNAGSLNWKEPADQISVGGNTFERLRSRG